MFELEGICNSKKSFSEVKTFAPNSLYVIYKKFTKLFILIDLVIKFLQCHNKCFALNNTLTIPNKLQP